MLNFPVELGRFPRVLSLSILAGLFIGYPIGLSVQMPAKDLVIPQVERSSYQSPVRYGSTKENSYSNLARRWVHASLECPFVSECKIAPVSMREVMTEGAQKQFENYFGSIGMNEGDTRIYSVFAGISDSNESSTGKILQVVLNAPESEIPSYQARFEIEIYEQGNELKISDLKIKRDHKVSLEKFVKLAREKALGEMKWEAIQLLADSSFLWSEDQLPILDEATDLNPNLVLAHIKKSRIYDVNKNYASALLELDEVVRILPGYANARIARGVVKCKLHKEEDSLSDFDAAIKMAPKIDISYFYRGRAYLKLGRYDEALADFSKAEKLNPTEFAYPGETGMALMWKHRYKDAIKKFDQCLAMKGRSVGYCLKSSSCEVYVPGFFGYKDRCINFERGFAYHWLKDKAKAKADYQAVLHTNYSKESKLNAITGLARLQIGQDNAYSILSEFDYLSREYRDIPTYVESRAQLIKALSSDHDKSPQRHSRFEPELIFSPADYSS